MTRPVLLNNVDHHDLRVIVRAGAEFGDSINMVRLFATEFEPAQRDFPILFKQTPEGWHAFALLGLDRDENLFLDGERWTSRHVPILQQRGPFMIGVQERVVDGEARREPMIQIDLDHARIARDGTGERVFLEHGGNAPYLDHVSRVLQAIYAGLEVNDAMFQAFAAAGLLREVELKGQLNDAESFTIEGYATIDEERLAALGGDALAALNAQGFLRAAFLASASLANLDRLTALKNRKNAGG